MEVSNRNPIKAEKLFEEAIALRDSHKPLEAIEKFREILSISSKYEAAIFGLMGHIYYQMKDLSNSLDCYQKSTNLSPKSELASIGLFHTLWDLGREWDALAEAKRFLSLCDSEEYLLMIEEMRDSFEAAGIDLNN